MKLTFNNIIKAFSLLFFVTSFTACSSGLVNKNPQKNSEQKFTVRGKILSEIRDGGRSAVTSFSLPSGSTYSISACRGTETGTPSEYSWDTSSAISASVNMTTLSYSLELTQPGHWKFTLYMVDSLNNSSELLAQEIDITTSDTTITQDFQVKPLFTAGTTSNISLKISRVQSSSDIQNVKWHWLDSGLSLDDSEKKFDEGVYENGHATVTFNYSDIPVGTYNVQLIFIKTNGDEYSFNDVVNVSTGFTTDTLYGDSVQLTKDDLTNTYSFIVSDALLESQAKVRPYKTTLENTPYLLYSVEAKEALRSNWDNDAEVWITQYDNTYGISGAKVFNEIKGGENITKSIFNSTNFCFGQDCIYAVEEESGQFKLNKYIESYAGFVKSTAATDSVNLSGLASSATQFGQIVYSNDSIYFFYSTSSQILLAKLSGIENLSTSTLATSQLEGITVLPSAFTVSASTDGSNQTSGIVFYAVRSSSDNDTLYRQEFTFDENNSSFTLDTSKKTYLLTLPDFNCYTYFHFSDLLIQNNPVDNKDYLYALAYTFGSYPTLYESEDYEFYQGKHISNGGVIRFDLENSATNFEPSTWIVNEEPVLMLGCYIEESVSDYYSDSAATNAIIESGQKYVFQAPLDFYNGSYQDIGSYFYGPKRFIARKPGKLVIADDGGWIDPEDDGTIAPKNRVVTVNLSDNSLSIVEVKTTFQTHFEYTSKFILTE